MQHPFNVESPYRGRLADLVTRFADVEVRKRALEVERSALLAEAYELAELEGTRLVLPEPGSLEAELAAVQARAGVAQGAASEQDLSQGPTQNNSQGQSAGLPRGSVVWRDRAHRVVRAELAAPLHVSEWCIGNDITHAVDALERCPVLVAAQARGEVTEKHVRSVVEAGRIIGHRATEQISTTLVDNNGVPLDEDAADLEIKRRYALFDRTLLPHAQSLTPKLLVPVAKRIAEKLAGVSFDDRHRIAKRDRHVRLTELEDGMCHLTALLTSFEAHAIFDRLTQYGKRLQATDVPTAGSKAPGGRGAAAPLLARTSGGSGMPGGPLASGGQLASDAQRTSAAPRTSSDSAQMRGSAPGDGTSVLTGPGSGLIGAAATAVLNRPLGEARADSLVSLLLEGEVEERPEGLMRRRGPRVAARVQVLVPVSLTGRLDGATTPQAAAPQHGTGGTGGTDVTGSTGSTETTHNTGDTNNTGGTGSTGSVSGAANTGDTSSARGTGSADGADNIGGADGADTPGIGDGWFQPELVGVGPIDTDTAALISHDTPTWDMIVVDDGTRDNGCTGICACTHERKSSTESPDSADPHHGGPNTGGPNTGSLDGVGSNIDTVGDILTVDGYRVPAHIRRHLAARDLRCRFPGCDLPVYRCDVDHTIAAEDGGPTSTNNCGFLCRGHHVLKHHGGCIPEQNGRGDFTWTFPTGRTYKSQPPSKVTFSTAICSPDVRGLVEQDRQRYPYGRDDAVDDKDADARDADARGPVGGSPQGSTRDSNHGSGSDSNSGGASNGSNQRGEDDKPDQGSAPSSGINSDDYEQPF